jgi:hypothetical protein
MVLKGKWVCSKAGKLIKIKENTVVGTIISADNEEMFLRINGEVFDPNDVTQRNRAFLKAFYRFLETVSWSNESNSITQDVIWGDIAITKTALHSLLDFMLFGGSFENVPQYIKEAING